MAEGSRYETILKLASGGMATVWIGTVRGALGFRQLVAIKKPHPHLLSDAGFRGELVAEARLASMIHHANVVDVRDVEIEGDSISLVMDYIEGASLGDLLVAASRKNERLSPRVAIRIVLDACAGLHAAHELVDERGRPVGLVHRDVSPQNILVGADGISRVADFGVAKFARKHMQSTSEGSLKGKLAYMAPEYVRGEAIDRRFDVFALGVVLWESLAGKRCFRGDNEAETLRRLLDHDPDAPSRIAPELAPLDAAVGCALAKNREERFQNTTAMAAALEASALSAGLLGGHSEVAKAVKELLGGAMEERRALVRAKLANEPSVASLMGVPNLVPRLANERASDIPATATATATGTAAAATPKMGGGGQPQQNAQPTAATLAVGSVIPSTQPMTPRMEAAPQPPPARTLPSALPLEAPPAIGSAPAPSGPGAIASARPQVDANYTLRSDAPPPVHEPPRGEMNAATQLSFNDPSAPIPPSSMEVAGVPAKRRWMVPVLVGVAAIVIAIGAFAIKKNQTTTATEPTASATVSAPVPSASMAATASSAEIVATAVTSAPPPATTPAATATAKSTATFKPRPLPAPQPTPTTSATTSGRKPPPPNPYP